MKTPETETDYLHPVVDPLVVGFVLNQAVQALTQLLSAQLLLTRLLTLLPQSKLHLLHTHAHTHLSTPVQCESEEH